MYHFGGPWVRIQARTENMSVIFFCADFSRFSYLKLASDSFGGVHNQCGLSKERGRCCWAAYVIIQFDVSCAIFFCSSLRKNFARTLEFFIYNF